MLVSKKNSILLLKLTLIASRTSNLGLPRDVHVNWNDDINNGGLSMHGQSGFSLYARNINWSIRNGMPTGERISSRNVPRRSSGELSTECCAESGLTSSTPLARHLSSLTSSWARWTPFALPLMGHQHRRSTTCMSNRRSGGSRIYTSTTSWSWFIARQPNSRTSTQHQHGWWKTVFTS